MATKHLQVYMGYVTEEDGKSVLFAAIARDPGQARSLINSVYIQGIDSETLYDRFANGPNEHVLVSGNRSPVQLSDIELVRVCRAPKNELPRAMEL